MNLLNLLSLVFLTTSLVLAQSEKEGVILNADVQGFIPAWVVTGPIEFPITGFGIAKDTVAINEPDISPVEGDYAKSNLPEKEKTLWFLQSVDEKGFIDFKKTLEWIVDTAVPVKIWFAKAGYAFTTIMSEKEREVLLTLGSNSQIAVFLNGEKIHTTNEVRNAVKDQDTIRIKLKKGINDLIVRVINTQTNLGIAFFGVIQWQWGFYSRLLELDGKPVSDVKYLVKGNNKSTINAVSTFYFKKIDNLLNQRIDLEVNSTNHEMVSSELKIKIASKTYSFKLDSVRFGKTRHSVYIPELIKNVTAEIEMILSGHLIRENLELKKQKKYDLHVMLLNHTDVGYTHPQPVCEELHCNTLDDVLKMCKDHPDFHWTIETTWQIEAYEKLRTKEKFLELISLIKKGRIAVSPIYTNPFTGYVSEEEMLRSFEKGIEYKNKYGITFLGAVYNDVPGQAWFLPQALAKTGVKFIAEGINEVYGDYKLQRNLPKVFKWEAADGSQVVTYINEAYNEGKNYGLESGDLFCVEQSIWQRINKLESKNYQPDIILINTSFSDNSILAAHQYHLAMKWNEQYEYPKFISSDVNIFADALIKSEAYRELPVLKGDWTSNWDIFYQGEFERHKVAREIQHNLLSAEKVSTLSSLLNNSKLPMNTEISNSYRSLLQFSGHGSGLEYGYGSPEDNKLTMKYRQNYIDDAYLGAEAVLLKGLQQITKSEESLESEGLFVFNPLSWHRNEVVEIDYPFDNSPEYDIIDAGTNKVIPSFRVNHKQYFVAKDVPSFGYKKFMLKRKSGTTKYENGLVKTNNSIENQFYKITLDGVSVSSILDKKSGMELLNGKSSFGLAVPTIEKYQLNQNHSTITGNKVNVTIIDESPIKLTVNFSRENDVIEHVNLSLSDGIDKVYVTATANLAVMKHTQVTEEYGLPFSFNIPGARVKAEILGGFIEQDKDRFPGIDHDGVSLRRSVSIFNDTSNILWSTADARVIRIRKDSASNEPVIISNLINNFPQDWNRYEELTGKIEFRYVFASGKGSFDAATTTMFGYELNTPLLLRKNWFKALPPSEEYIKIDNKNIILLNLKSVEQGKIIRLINADVQANQTARIRSKIFKGFNASTTDLLGNSLKKLPVINDVIEVTLKAGEFVDILINYEKK